MKKPKKVNVPHKMDKRGNEICNMVFDDLGMNALGRAPISMTTLKLDYPGAEAGHHYFHGQNLLIHCVHGTIQLCLTRVTHPEESADWLLSAGEGALVPAGVAYAIYNATPQEDGPAFVQIFSTSFPSLERPNDHRVPRPPAN